MSYLPLALKYRPRRFAEVVGQGPVAETLRNAIRQDRVAQAFLFMGSRGVGKTSMARILAKAINCRACVDGEPCGSCEICEAIAAGQDLDVIEIDGASNRGIDEIRTIRENVAYAPTRGRAKIYIIDEVHMLTIQAFNALLKTLEEPPPHVHFIFATTEAQAVPETILSRCQRFEFHRIGRAEMMGHLQEICLKEGVEAATGVLEEVVTKGEGGLRDALSLLDQLVAFSGQKLQVADLDAILGTIDSEHLGGILSAVGCGDVSACLESLDTVFEAGRDAEDILMQVVDLLREAMSRECRGLPGGGEGRRAPLVELIRKDFDLDRILLALRLCLNTRREMKLSGLPRVQIEVCFLKLCRSKDLIPIARVLERLDSLGAGQSAAPAASRGEDVRPFRRPSVRGASPPSKDAASPVRAPDNPRPKASPQAAAPTQSSGAPAASGAPVPAPKSIEEVRERWGAFLNALRTQSKRASAFLESGRPQALEGLELQVLLPAAQSFSVAQLRGALGHDVRRVAPAILGAGIKLTYSLAKAEQELAPRQSVYENKNVRKIIDHFEGSVVGVDDQESD